MTARNVPCGTRLTVRQAWAELMRARRGEEHAKALARFRESLEARK